MAAKFLMCSPEHYEEALPLCQRTLARVSVNGTLARAQWQILYKVLTDQIGAEVELIEPVRGLPNMVFAAHAGIVSGKTFIRSNYRVKERQPEGAFFEKWFEEHGYSVATIAKGFIFDGEGDMIPHARQLFYGYHSKSELHMPELVSAKMELGPASLQLIDDRFHHLDTCLAVLNPDTILYYRDAFSEGANQILRDTVKNCIVLRRDEALAWACNSIVIDKRIIISNECHLSSEMLRLLGYRVYRIDISEFRKACISVKSLVLRIA